MTQDVKWLVRYEEVVSFIEANHRNPSKHRVEKLLYVLLGILNSKLVLYWLKTMRKRKGDILELYAKPLNDIPIKVPKGTQDLETMVKSILEAKKDDTQTDTCALVNEIDQKVYHLYGLTYDEVLIVDPETPITREEYENISISKKNY